MEKVPAHLNLKNGKGFFPKIRPILEAGEAIVLLDESDIKEDKFCKRIIILNTGDEIKINHDAGYVSKSLYLIQRILSLIAFVGLAVFGVFMLKSILSV